MTVAVEMMIDGAEEPARPPAPCKWIHWRPRRSLRPKGRSVSPGPWVLDRSLRPLANLRTSTTTQVSSPAIRPSSDLEPGGSGPWSLLICWRCCSKSTVGGCWISADGPRSSHAISPRPEPPRWWACGRRRVGADAGSGASQTGPSACDLLSGAVEEVAVPPRCCYARTK